MAPVRQQIFKFKVKNCIYLWIISKYTINVKTCSIENTKCTHSTTKQDFLSIKIPLFTLFEDVVSIAVYENVAARLILIYWLFKIHYLSSASVQVYQLVWWLMYLKLKKKCICRYEGNNKLYVEAASMFKNSIESI